MTDKQCIPIFTIGYEGVTAEQFVARLKAEGVELLLDVRIRAGSRKKGLSKSPLSESLAEVGIEYHHDRDLGTPKEMMKTKRETGAYDWDEYLAFLKTKMVSVEFAAFLSSKKRVCLMCFEADYKECHRKIVADEISKITGGAKVHLRFGEDGSNKH